MRLQAKADTGPQLVHNPGSWCAAGYAGSPGG